jgi:hypothetical protein
MVMVENPLGERGAEKRVGGLNWNFCWNCYQKAQKSGFANK